MCLNLFPAGILQKYGIVDVFYMVAQEDIDDDGIKAVLDFVEKGGGLLICGHAWAWKTKNRNFQLEPGSRRLNFPKRLRQKNFVHEKMQSLNPNFGKA